jgi:hypothetical protein
MMTMESKKTGHPVLDRIEPDAEPINDSAALASIAISLKRIADMMESDRPVRGPSDDFSLIPY